MLLIKHIFISKIKIVRRKIITSIFEYIHTHLSLKYDDIIRQIEEYGITNNGASQLINHNTRDDLAIGYDVSIKGFFWRIFFIGKTLFWGKKIKKIDNIFRKTNYYYYFF